MDIPPAQWDFAQSLFEGAIQREPQERASYLESVCPTDPDLRRAVLEMVALHEGDPDFLEMPALVQLLTAPLLAEGEVVAERFQIVRRVGFGGMGEVYEAQDLLNPNHPERVALKIVRPGLASVDALAARMHREIQLAHRITHSSVCRIHFLHVDRRPEGDRLFLIMELLDGETIRERVSRTGPLGRTDAFAVAAQIAAGLDEAHREGVIHKDLKSSNIMLVPRKDGTTRAVITDFGIAASEEEAFRLGSGTHAYMAPERLVDAGATKEADIYSFGVVLYEMVTGQLPFDPDVPLDKRPSLPKAPSTTRRGFGRRWDRVILRCLDPAPAARFRRASDAVDGLRPRRWWVPTAAAAVALLIAWPIVERTVNRAPATTAKAAVAILPFEAVGAARLHDGLLNYVGERIQNSPTIRNKWLIFSTAEAREQGVTTVERARAIFGAAYVIAGTITGDGASVTITGQLLEAGGVRPVRTFMKMCPLDNEVCLQDGVLREVAGLLDPESPSPSTLAPMAKEVLPYYLQAMEYLHRDSVSYALAIDFFRKAIARDPSAVLAHVGLADALILRFRDTADKAALTEARAVLEKALASNPDLPELHASLGNLYRLEGRYDTAAREILLAVGADPSNHVFHRMLGDVYNAAGQDADAMAAFEKVIELQPRYWAGYHNYAVFHYRRGRYEQAAALLETSIAWTPDHAQSLATLGGVYVALGRNADAERVSRRSCALIPTRTCYVNLGIALQRERRTEEAIDAYKQALAFGTPTETLLLNIADAYVYLGEHGEAQRYFRDAVTRAEEGLRVNLQNSAQRAILAYSLAQIGDKKRAIFEMEQALQHSPRDRTVQRYGILTFESMGQRERALEIVRSSPAQVLEELESTWGTEQLRADTRYRALEKERSQ